MQPGTDPNESTTTKHEFTKRKTYLSTLIRDHVRVEILFLIVFKNV